MYKEEINKIILESLIEFIQLRWKTSDNEYEFSYFIKYLISTEDYLIHKERELSIPWDWIIGYYV